jgi:hypothetical protein
MIRNPTECGPFSLLDDICCPEAAQEAVERLLHNKSLTLFPMLSGAGRFSLLQKMTIPGSDDTTRNFQCLHFDGGIPLLVNSPQDLVLFTALYLPKTGTPSSASTRFIDLDAITQQARWGTLPHLEDRLTTYWKNLGSSWNWDDDRSYKESCFARIVDAFSGTEELTNFRKTPQSEWSKASREGNEFGSIEDESAFFKRHGIEIEAVAKSIKLQPGQLILFDNTRMVHGRVGRRKKHEIFQMSYGLKNVSEDASREFATQFLLSFAVPS